MKNDTKPLLPSQRRGRFDLPSVTLALTPGSMAPLHYRIACADALEQERVLRRVELAWRIFAELARELAA